MPANFRAQIDIAALAKGVPDVRTLRQELEKLAKAADGVEKPRKVGLDLSGFASQLKAVGPGVTSLISSLNGLTSSFTGQAAAARAAGQAQVTALKDVQAQMQRYIQLANQAAAASAKIKPVPVGAVRAADGGGVGLGVAAAGAAAYGGVKSLVSTGMELQGVKATLSAANDNDPKKAAADYDYLVQQALKWGANLKSVGSEFANIKIAAGLAGQAQGFSVEHTETVAKGLFESLLKFKTAMGKSDADVKLVTKSFTDMLSKGTVASEELKKQLGNHMPGALALGAKAVGLTTTELMDKLKSGSIQAYQFVALMTEQINAKYGDSAEKHSRDMQASLTRVGLTWDLLKNSIGEAGLFEGVAKSANELATYLASPEAKAGARDLGLAIKDVAKSIVDGTKAAADFYKEHKGGIDTVAQFLAILLGVNLAMKAAAGLFGALLGPIIGLATQLGALSTKIGPLGPAITGLGTSLAGAGGSAAALGAAMVSMGKTLMGSPYAALIAVANLIKQINDGRDFQKLGERIGSYQEGLVGDPAKLKAKIADLKKAIAEDESSWIANGARAVAQGGFADKRLSGMKTELANYEKLLAASDALAAKQAKAEAAKPKAKVNPAEMRAGVFGPGKNKDAGSAAASGESRLGSAEMSAASAAFKLASSEINQQLASNTISYNQYVDAMKQAYADELNAQVAALDKQLANVKDPSRRAAIKQERIQSMLDGYLAAVNTVETQADEKRKKLADDILGIQSALAGATGDATTKSLADIEKKYADTMARMVANGETQGIETLKRLINVEYATSRLKDLDGALARVKLGEDMGQANLQLQAARGDTTTLEAESKALQIKQDAARLNLAIYQQQLDIAQASEQAAASEAEKLQAQSQQLALLQKIADAETTLAQKAQSVKAIEDAISTGFVDSVFKVNKGIKAVGDSMNSMLLNVRNSINKMIADDLAQQFKKAVFGSGSSGGGSKSLLGSLGSLLVDGAMSLFGSAPTSTGLFSTNAEAAVSTGMESFNSMDIVGVGGQSTMPSSQMVQNFNWSINAVDPNQFRNTQSQLIQDASLSMR